MMDTQADFETRLKNSAAVKSLRQEHDLALCLRQFDWEVVHGAFYLDPVEGKPREIDLHARQVWIKGDRVDPELFVTIELLIECKSITGWHLVFPDMFPLGILSNAEQNERYWIAEDKPLRNRLHVWLHEQGFPTGEIEALADALQLASYENRLRRTAETVPLPVTAPHAATTFSETNTSNVKDVDNSVLWRAISQLRSAAIAARNRAHDAAFAVLTTGGELEALQPATAQDLLMRWNRAAREVNVWQHVVAISGGLWALATGEVTPLKWTRLFRMQGGQCDSWCDIVSHTSTAGYLRSTTDHFSALLQKNGFEPR